MHRNARPRRGGAADPCLLSMDNRELETLENGHNASDEIKGTTTTIEGGSAQTKLSVAGQTVEGLGGCSDTNTLVSRSVQVESFPRVMYETHLVQQPVILKD